MIKDRTLKYIVTSSEVEKRSNICLLVPDSARTDRTNLKTKLSESSAFYLIKN